MQSFPNITSPTFQKTFEKWDSFIMAAGEGFEPSHTESESAVLPLHKPAVSSWNSYHYTKKLSLVKRFSDFFPNFFFDEKIRPFPPSSRRQKCAIIEAKSPSPRKERSHDQT